MGTQNKDKAKGRVAFIHPDLGLGGAERLIVDAAAGLKQEGYNVTIFTGYHDPNHAFPETTNGLLNVVPVGRWIPRTIFGKCVALMSYIKMVYAAFYIHMFSRFSPDVIVCDQVSACIPVLKLPRIFWSYPQVLFYCHYPDQLLTTRQTFLKALYRKPIDYVEEITTGWADKVVVNSLFTRSVFANTFHRLKITPDVLYPSINSNLFDQVLQGDAARDESIIPKGKKYFVSLNRFEPKKNIALAIRAMKKLKSCLTGTPHWDTVHLVVAGGYDPRLESSVKYLEELKAIVERENLQDHIKFVLSPKDADKIHLLAGCVALVYTPSEEHFGIVPLEAMYLGKPVIAVDSGGPRETIVESKTGFLCPSIDSHFGVAMARLVTNNNDLAKTLGENGKARFNSHFSFKAFSKSWDSLVKELVHSSHGVKATGNGHKHKD